MQMINGQETVFSETIAIAIVQFVLMLLGKTRIYYFHSTDV